MDDVEIFLQIFHLDYSEKLLSKLDDDELYYYLQDFLPRKWLDFSKSHLKSMCKSLKIFIRFLREKLHYYPDDNHYKKMRFALNANQIINTIDWGDEENDDDGIESAFTIPNDISFKYEGIIEGLPFFSVEGIGTEPSDRNISETFLKLMEDIRAVREREK